MDKAREEKFLKNLSEIVSKAESAGVGRSKMKGVIQRFKELWDARVREAEATQFAKLYFRSASAFAGFGLLMILTLLSMVLVLLAVERNTRANK